MIKSIRIKSSESEGQLNGLRDLRSRFSPFSFLNKWLLRDPELIKKSMIYNQFINIIEIIDIARFYLVSSSDKMACKYSREFLNETISDATERIASYFLISSIIFYNSSYDYLRILIRLFYSTREELIKQYEKKILSNIEKMKLDNCDWFVALFKSITDIKREDENIWINNNSRISEDTKKSFFELKKQNEILKRKYRANLIKHNTYPSFKRSNIGNSIDARLDVSMDSFFTNKVKISCAIPKMLEIEDVQKYLIEYDNLTVSTVKLIDKEIRIVEGETK